MNEHTNIGIVTRSSTSLKIKRKINSQNFQGNICKESSLFVMLQAILGSRYSRMDQVKLVEDSL